VSNKSNFNIFRSLFILCGITSHPDLNKKKKLGLSVGNNNNTNNNNNHDDIDSAVIMTRSVREFTRFIW